MTEMVTSESSVVSFSNNIATTQEMSTDSLAGRLLATNPVIGRATILLILTVINFCGNGFTLITIRLTPRLWTKANFILASMLVANVTLGFFILGYAPFLIVVYVFNDPCHYNMAIAVASSIVKLPAYVSIYHLILICVERYIAIVYPLHYETKFTDRTLKWSIFACWVSWILFAMTWLLGLINADLLKCNLIHPQYYLSEVFLLYLPVCVSMFVSYGKILHISWRHRRHIEPVNVNSVLENSVRVPAIRQSQSSRAHSIENPTPPIPLVNTGPSAGSAVTSGTESVELAEQQRQKTKSRRREFKAVYLTAAIVGTFVILWFPTILGRVLARQIHVYAKDVSIM